MVGNAHSLCGRLGLMEVDRRRCIEIEGVIPDASHIRTLAHIVLGDGYLVLNGRLGIIGRVVKSDVTLLVLNRDLLRSVTSALCWCGLQSFRGHFGVVYRHIRHIGGLAAFLTKNTLYTNRLLLPSFLALLGVI